MRVFHSLEEYKSGPNPVATIGTFDGVHIGHKTILSRLKETARQMKGESVLISFHPHPRLVLFPEQNSLRLLQTIEEKIELLDEFGIDRLLVIPFTKEFSRTSSRSFIQNILVEKVGIKKIVIGYDHRFGKNRTGGIEELNRYAVDNKFEVEEIPAQAIDDANVSSTKIRNALLDLDFETARRYLGYGYSFRGEVMPGEKQGRLLGYPTANIKIDYPWKLVPQNGVYFVRAFVREEKDQAWGEPIFGMMNIGVKPTMGKHARGAETYLFDFDRDIYGHELKVEPLEYIRKELKFDSLDELVKAIDGDKELSLSLMSKYS